MASHICIFEDAQVGRLFPLVYLRPAYDLRCGITTLREKIVLAYPKGRVSLHCRSYLADYVRHANPNIRVNQITSDECLFINGRVLADRNFARTVPLNAKNDALFVSGGVVVGARLSGDRLVRLWHHFADGLTFSGYADLPKIEVEAVLVSYPWDLVHQNGSQLVQDFETLVSSRKKAKQKKFAGSYLLGKEGIAVDPSAEIQPGVVLNAEDGPIYIGKNVKILPFTSIVGPASIGEGSIIKAGSTIYENTSIGPVCKIGGEIEESIIQGYSNKQHSGFLGHSYLGSWVNLGAGTNNSDLKNNYGSVKVQLGAEQIDTALQFVGLTMGDHSKSAINTVFNTGTVVGVSCNIFGSGFPPKYVPSFAWGGGGQSLETYDVKRAISVARKVMARRKIEMTSVEETLLNNAFDMTRTDRQRAGMST
jgi:UDP-N-acetylglucosamine diphosphorylase/glucosamine-1-phosphate N-acetyltransferase